MRVRPRQGHNGPHTCGFEDTSGHKRLQTWAFHATGHNRPRTCDCFRTECWRSIPFEALSEGYHRGPAREDTKTLSLSVAGIGAVESSTESKTFQERFHDSVAQVKNFRWKRAASAALTPRPLGLLLWPEQSGREATSSKTA